MEFIYRKALRAIGVGVVAVLALPAMSQQHMKIAGINYTIKTFDVPGALPSANSPSAARISDFGEVVGNYVDSSNKEHGFYKLWNGPVVAPLDDPNGDFGFSRVSGVNDFGAIAGGYLESTNNLGAFTEHGFVYKKGAFTDVNVGGLETLVNGINFNGDMVGQAVNATTGLNEAWISIRGRVTYLPDPVNSTFGQAINDFGAMTLISQNSAGAIQSFYRSANGKISNITVAGSVSTEVAALDDFGFAVGQYVDAAGNHHGFAYQLSNGKSVSVDIPGATQTFLGGLNNLGYICGHYIDTAGKAHCYVAYPSFF
ncbi:MAG TPA: hypothetical protein VGL56_06750 [Fimbriimonadaceae bacterium]|jgi:hypothetical protein